LELYVAKEVADSVIAIASKFNVEAQIIGRVEASQEKKLTIKSEYGTFEY
jgi:phosphoribosylformylglycinamidine cyclo-ligase